jgi:hypothetical protein
MNYQDTIQSLPVEETTPDQEQLALVRSIFKEENAKDAICLFSEFKDVLLIVILFILFSTTHTDDMVRRYVPFTRNNYTYLVGVKSLCVVFLYYMFKNFQVISK